MIRSTRETARRGPLALAAVALALGVTAWVSVARSQPTQGTVLARAREAFDRRQYQGAVDLLRPALYPASKFATEDDEAEAYRILGMSYWWLAQVATDPAARTRLEEDARRELRALLALRPKAEISPLTNPPALSAFLEEVRRRLKTVVSPKKALELELDSCKRTLTRQGQAYEAYRRECRSKVVETERVVRRQFFWNFVPFGTGQFQNGHTLKGGLFAASQGVLLALNVTTLILGETPWIRNGAGRTVKRDEVSLERAATLQKIQIASGTVFWALVAWGIIDAVVYYRKTQVIRTRKQVPLEVGGFEITPELGKDGLGLGLTKRF